LLHGHPDQRNFANRTCAQPAFARLLPVRSGAASCLCPAGPAPGRFAEVVPPAGNPRRGHGR